MVYINPLSKVVSKQKAPSAPKVTQPKIAIGEVLQVIYTGPQSGFIRYRHEGNNNASVVGIQNLAQPLLANIKLYPVAGEKVVLLFLGNVYYLPLNLWNNPVNNMGAPVLNSTLKDQRDDITKILANNKTFNSSNKVHVVTALQEGDVVFEGRFGQSIKFGSTVKENGVPRTPYSVSDLSNNGDPITIIRNEINTPFETVKDDGSAVYMCSTQALEMDDGNAGFEGILGAWSTINVESKDYAYEPAPYTGATVEDEQDQFQNQAPATQQSNTPSSTYTPGNTPVQDLEKVDGSYQSYVSGIPQGMVELYVVDGCPVSSKVTDPYLKMKEAAANAGVTLQLNSGFRANENIKMPDGSIKEGQNSVYQKYLNGGNLAAKPGYSNHQNGSALDINISNSNTYKWLVQNAITYGFVRGVASERWHWEYKPSASTIYAKVPKSHPTWDGFDKGMV